MRGGALPCSALLYPATSPLVSHQAVHQIRSTILHCIASIARASHDPSLSCQTYYSRTFSLLSPSSINIGIGIPNPSRPVLSCPHHHATEHRIPPRPMPTHACTPSHSPDASKIEEKAGLSDAASVPSGSSHPWM